MRSTQSALYRQLQEARAKLLKELDRIEEQIDAIDHTLGTLKQGQPGRKPKPKPTVELRRQQKNLRKTAQQERVKKAFASRKAQLTQKTAAKKKPAKRKQWTLSEKLAAVKKVDMYRKKHGCPIEEAAKQLKIPFSSYYRWKKLK